MSQTVQVALTICARIVGAIGQFASVRGAGCLIFSYQKCVIVDLGLCKR